MALESCPLRPTEPKFPREVWPSMQTAVTKEEDKFLSFFQDLYDFVFVRLCLTVRLRLTKSYKSWWEMVIEFKAMPL